jgi:uncharacterized linocin/CFP29 family protein
MKGDNMDILKRSLAPITEQAWHEIEKEAKSVLTNNLSARKFVDVIGPKGFDFTAFGLGRLHVPAEQPYEGVSYGVHQVQPLIEIRVPFELNIWELDNIVRGAKDIDLTPLTEAAKKAANFEDQVIYHGFEQGNIKGLANSTAYPLVELSLDGEGILEGVSKAVLILKDEAIEGPYTMIVGHKVWQTLNVYSSGYPIRKNIEKLIGGPVIYSPVVESNYLVPSDADSLQLIIGQDFSVGYETNTSRTVRLYITESFTFRVLDPRYVLHFGVKG